MHTTEKTSTRGRRPHAATRSDEGTAFLPDPYDRSRSRAHTDDVLAEALAEDFVITVTSAEEAAEDQRDEVSPEEVGGPFVETTTAEEVGPDDDEATAP
jgi:hypothetical protein